MPYLRERVDRIKLEHFTLERQTRTYYAIGIGSPHLPRLEFSLGQNLYASHELRDTAIGRNPETELLLSLDSISTAYWATTVGKNMRSALANPFSRCVSEAWRILALIMLRLISLLFELGREDGHPKALVKEKYSISLLQSTLELTSRQFKMSHRNKVLAKGRLMQVALQ